MVRHSSKSQWKKKSISIRRQMISCTCRRCAAGARVHTGSRGGQPLTQKVWNGREIGRLTVLQKILEEFFFFWQYWFPRAEDRRSAWERCCPASDVLTVCYIHALSAEWEKQEDIQYFLCLVQWVCLLCLEIKVIRAVILNRNGKMCTTTKPISCRLKCFVELRVTAESSSAHCAS